MEDWGRAIAAVALCGLLAGVQTGCASSTRTAAPSAEVAGGAQRVEVTLTDSGCSPDRIVVQPGPVAFVASNTSTAAASFAVVSGDRAVGELERVPAGGSSVLTLDLVAGGYRSVCRFASSTGGGSIQVGDGSASPEVGPTADVAEATAAYRAALVVTADQAIAVADQLMQAADAGDVAGARRADGSLRRLYGGLAPAARDFHGVPVVGRDDLDARIDPQPGAGPTASDPSTSGASDPSATGGLPRIEAAIWGQGTTAGVAVVAAQVGSDLSSLRDRIGAVSIDVTEVAASLSAQIGRGPATDLARAGPSAEVRDLFPIAGAVDAAGAFTQAYGGAIGHRDPEAAARLVDRVAQAQAVLAAALEADPHARVAPDVLREVAVAVDALADAVAAAGAELARPVAS